MSSTQKFDTYSKGELLAALGCMEDNPSAAVIVAHHATGITTYRFKKIDPVEVAGRNRLVAGARNRVRRTQAKIWAPAALDS